MKAVVRKKFIDKYTNEKHEAGDLLDLEPERYEEIRKKDADLVIAVAAEQGAAGQSTTEDTETEDGKAEQGAAGQSAADDAKTEDGKTEQEAAGKSTAEDAETADQSAAEDTKTAKGKKEPKKKDQKSAE